MRSCNFDERQLFIRGNIFKHMTITFVVLLFVNAFLISSGIVWADAFHSNMIIVLIAAAIGSNEMIFKEVYASKSGMQNRMVILIGVISAVCLIRTILYFAQGDRIIQANQLTDTGGIFVMSLLLFSIFLGFIIKTIIKRAGKLEEQ